MTETMSMITDVNREIECNKMIDVERLENKLIELSDGEELLYGAITPKVRGYEQYHSREVRWIAKRYDIIGKKICIEIQDKTEKKESEDNSMVYSVQISGTPEYVDMFITNTDFQSVSDIKFTLVSIIEE